MFLLLTASCASTDSGNSEVTLFCTEERELGSYIPKKTCKSVKQREREHRDAEEVLRNPTVNPDGTRSG